jgi:hypothetical protein
MKALNVCSTSSAPQAGKTSASTNVLMKPEEWMFWIEQVAIMFVYTQPSD